MRIDLHTHSAMSDGTETPHGVVAAAQRERLDIVALTDHDTFAGLDEAADAAERMGMGFVPGVEVSAREGDITVHMLVYWPDARDQEFADVLGSTRNSRVGRAQEMVRRLAHDHPITWEQVFAQANGATIGRPHIADVLVTLGVVPDRSAAFEEILAPWSPYYVDHRPPRPAEVIAHAVRMGAVSVLAHPGAEVRGWVLSDDTIAELARVGMHGLEVYHRDHSPEQVERLARLAQQHDLIVTGSSDYHGAGKENRIGENLTPVESFRRLEQSRRV